VLTALEQPHSLSDPALEGALIQGLNEVLERKENEMSSLTQKMLHLLLETEEEVSKLVRFLLQCYASDLFRLRNFVSECVKNLVNVMVQKKNLQVESVSIRNTKTILTAVTL
jgi:hypothetical protein